MRRTLPAVAATLMITATLFAQGALAGQPAAANARRAHRDAHR
jgi:hypothetical protein